MSQTSDVVSSHNSCAATRVNVAKERLVVGEQVGTLVLCFFVMLLGLAAGPDPAVAGQAPQASISIGAGVTITQQNWQHYRQFMSVGLAALFEGKQFWHLPTSLQIEIGPTISIPLPKKYLDDTAKYSKNVKLLRTTSGGYVPSGYVAGLPFPHPLEGDPAVRGQQIFWNAYYRCQPRVQSAPGYSYTLDRYGHMTQTSEFREVDSRLAYLSDLDYPQTIPEGTPYYFVRFEQQLAPEQGKYSTVLDLAPTDPTQFDELYAYVPTLRRSLRLSQAARCAPLFGSDYLNDDENNGPPGLPQLFQIEYIGQKKLLTLEHAARDSFDSPGTPTQLDNHYYYEGSEGVIPFPRPSMGKWELRDTYVISLKRLPQFAKGYCYGERVMYVDKENYFGAGQLDLYDASGDLFKTLLVLLHPAEVPATDGDTAELLSGLNTGLLVNFRNKHVTVSPYLRPCVNTECAEEGYLDISRYASPEGLAKIVQ
jgi:Protein of unknown function (DUF1329)